MKEGEKVLLSIEDDDDLSLNASRHQSSLCEITQRNCMPEAELYKLRRQKVRS